MRAHYILLLFFSLFLSINSVAQNQDFENEALKDSSRAFAEIYGMASSSYVTPFWLHANQFGTVPNKTPIGAARVGYHQFVDISEPEKGKAKWSAGGGIEAVMNVGEINKFILPQAYGTIRFKNWELFAGRKKQWVGLADSTLGTGSFAWSGNALPIPKIQLGTRRFVNVPWTKGWLSFNAFYSDGLYEKGRPYTSKLKLHQKAFYLRIGNQTSKIKLVGGFNHQVQWGGISSFETVDGRMPRGLKNYFRAVTGKRYPTGADLGPFDYQNRVGNHLGTIDMGLEYHGFDYTWFFYRQNIYEDGSLYQLTNIADGLNGISIHKKNSYGADFEINHIVVEFLYTKSQGGGNWDLKDVLGRDNYFNHVQVRDGWSYYDRTIGTPFIPPTSDTKWKWPSYWYTSNSRVAVAHLGLEGLLYRKIQWMTKFSVSSNSGVYDAPLAGTPIQFSGIIALQTKLDILGGMIAKGSLAADIGDLYQKSYGFSLGLRKDFSFE